MNIKYIKQMSRTCKSSNAHNAKHNEPCQDQTDDMPVFIFDIFTFYTMIFGCCHKHIN